MKGQEASKVGREVNKREVRERYKKRDKKGVDSERGIC